MIKINSSEITPEHAYLSRRKFIAGVGALLTSAALSACLGQEPGPTPSSQAPSPTSPGPDVPTPPGASPTPPPAATATPGRDRPQAGARTDELGDELTPYEDVTGYNNYYEFTTDKRAVARLAQDFKTSPWKVEVGGLVHTPKTFDLDDLRRLFPPEERVYRLRCVETWSMVIPWLGFPLAKLLEEVEPTSKAEYVRFETLYDPEQLPAQESGSYPWPYVEGLRLDEAVHDLALLATGLYGKPLLPQSGAPIRLVVPWKYGFKSLKSIVKIELVEDMPTSFWMAVAPHEYGFYANVNPGVPHPRWPQAMESRVGESGRRETLPFNGYAEEVAHLYAGMDLRKFY